MIIKENKEIRAKIYVMYKYMYISWAIEICMKNVNICIDKWEVDQYTKFKSEHLILSNVHVSLFLRKSEIEIGKNKDRKVM